MGPIKRYIACISAGLAFSIPSIQLWGPSVYVAVKGYGSGFISEYNAAVERNANTPAEEWVFKSQILRDITKLRESGKELPDIVEWLKTR